VVPVLIEYERRAREFLVRETQQNVHDQVSRAYGILRTAQTITAEETMQLLSRVRMGVLLGLIGDVDISAINVLLVRTQPAHLQHEGPQHRAGPLPPPPLRGRHAAELSGGRHRTASLRRSAATTGRGTNRDRASSSASGVICLSSDDEMWE